MTDRELPYSKHQKWPTTTMESAAKRSYVTWSLLALTLLILLAQVLTGRSFGRLWLALSWEQSIENFKIWQFLSYPFSVPGANFQTPFHRVLFAWEWLVPLFIMVTLGSQVERSIGWQRYLFGLFLITLFTGIVGLSLCQISPELGRSAAGPMGLGLGLLSFHLFLCPKHRFFGVVPGPLAFLLLAALMITIVVIDVLAYSPAGAIPERNQLALLPGVLCGGSVLYFDAFFKETRQKLRDKREVALLIEEVDSRAQVEQLLSKISATGMGSLTSAEKTFLKNASRFYHNDRS
jgi:hypothetical protein